jgi:hypothetical protein
MENPSGTATPGTATANELRIRLTNEGHQPIDRLMGGFMRVTVETARILADEGEWRVHRKFKPRRPEDKGNRQDYFVTAYVPTYLVHWRPNPALPEDQQYCLVSTVS